MTDREKRIVVQLVASNQNTYKDLHSALPNIHNWKVLGFGERMSPDDVIKIDKQLSYSDALFYNPTDEDTFHLTEAGLDFLDKLRKEEKKSKIDKQNLSATEVSNALAKDNLEISQKALNESRAAKRIAFSALVVAIISLLYTIFSG